MVEVAGFEIGWGCIRFLDFTSVRGESVFGLVTSLEPNGTERRFQVRKSDTKTIHASTRPRPVGGGRGFARNGSAPIGINPPSEAKKRSKQSLPRGVFQPYFMDGL